jgi:hypothetical protein
LFSGTSEEVMKHVIKKNTPEVQVGQRYRMPSGAIAVVKHLRGDAEVGLEYESRRYKGRAEEVAMSMSNVRSICTYVGTSEV